MMPNSAAFIFRLADLQTCKLADYLTDITINHNR